MAASVVAARSTVARLLRAGLLVGAGLAAFADAPTADARPRGDVTHVKVQAKKTKERKQVQVQAKRRKDEPKAAQDRTTHDARRDKNGRIKRSAAAKHRFREKNPCPSTGRTSGRCPGYEVDHRRALACGGADSPGNMQWLTTKENRAKGADCARTR